MTVQEVFENWSAYLRDVDREDFKAQLSLLVSSERGDIIAARDLEWVKAIHDACSNVSPSDPQGKPIDAADIKRCVDAHVRIRLQFLSV